MGRLVAINVSERRGIQKHQIDNAVLKEKHGIVGDAHAGDWHRQVSILNKKDIDEFIARGAEVFPGAFGENLIIEGIDISSLKMRDRLQIGECIIELTQKGKECHNHCQIYHKMGECIMPVLGVFSEVIKGGNIKVGDEVKVIKNDDKKLTAAVITLSDRCFAKENEDISGPLLSRILKENDYLVIEEILLPDNKDFLKKELIRLADQREVNLILTTGGTGFAPKDITPEATLEVIERNAPGISEAIRAESMKHTPHGMLSRGVSGIRKQTLIINLPGSPKACEESCEVFIKSISHALHLLMGERMDK